MKNEIKKLDQHIKKQLIQILFEQCILDQQIYHISDAIKHMIVSLNSCYENHSIKNVHLPVMIQGGA